MRGDARSVMKPRELHASRRSGRPRFTLAIRLCLGRQRVRDAMAPSNIAQFAKDEAIRLAPTLRRVPQRLDTIADKLEHGRLTLNVSLFAENADARIVTRVTNLVLTTFIGATLGLISTMLFGVDGPQLTDNISLMGMLASFGLLLSIILLLRVLLHVLRDDDTPERV